VVGRLHVPVLADLEARDDVPLEVFVVPRRLPEGLERPDLLIDELALEVPDEPVGRIVPLVGALRRIEERARDRAKAAAKAPKPARRPAAKKKKSAKKRK